MEHELNNGRYTQIWKREKAFLWPRRWREKKTHWRLLDYDRDKIILWIKFGSPSSVDASHFRFSFSPSRIGHRIKSNRMFASTNGIHLIYTTFPTNGTLTAVNIWDEMCDAQILVGCRFDIFWYFSFLFDWVFIDMASRVFNLIKK